MKRNKSAVWIIGSFFAIAQGVGIFSAHAEVLVDPKATIDSDNARASELPKRIEAEGMVIQLSSSTIKQGNAFWVEVEGVQPGPKVQAWTEIDEIPTPLFSWIDSKGKAAFAGLVGIPFSEKPGISDLKIRISGGGFEKEVGAKIRVQTADPDRRAELLDLPEERVVPTSKEMAKRLAEEDLEIDRIFDIRSAERAWTKPIALPFNGSFRLSSPYGRSRIYSSRVQRRIHWGVDYALPVGTPIRASLAGRVVMAKEFGFMGKTVVIDHGYGLMTVYAHLEKIGVQLGQSVAHREVIGKSGQSGKSTGPLIHWKVVVSGVKVDPLSVVELMKHRI